MRTYQWQGLSLTQEQSFADVLQNRCSQKFLKYSQETPVLQSLFNKFPAQGPATLLKKTLQHRCLIPVNYRIPVNNAEFLRIVFFYRTPLVAVFIDTQERPFTVIQLPTKYKISPLAQSQCGPAQFLCKIIAKLWQVCSFIVVSSIYQLYIN